MKLYPANWSEVSKHIRLERAKSRCECTGECELYEPHPGPKRCIECNGPSKFKSGKRIILTVHHLCDCKPLCAIKSHLKAMCQPCHLLSDLRKKRGYRKAGIEAAKSKGALERRREALMAAWTRKYGKDDLKNPWSKENFTL